MLTTKAFYQLGYELRLRIGGTVLFGAYRGQYISVKLSQQEGYIISIRLKEEVESSAKLIFKQEDRKKITGLRRIRLNLNPKYLELKGIGVGLSNKKSLHKLKTTIDNVINHLETIQNFPNASSEATMLIEDIPGPATDELISKEEVGLEDIARKIDDDRGLLMGGTAALVCAFVLGLFSALLNKYGNGDLNPFGKGFIALGITAAFYAKFAGGLSKNARFKVLIISVLVFFIWDIFRIFFLWEISSSRKFSINELIESYKHNLLAGEMFSKFALIALGTILVGSLFMLRQHKTKAFVVRGTLIDEKLLEILLRQHKLEIIWLICIFISSLVGMMLALGSNTAVDEFAYVDLTNLYVIVVGILIVSTITLTKVFERIAEKTRQAWEVLYDLKSVRVPALFMSLTICAGISAGAGGIISWFNLSLDRSEPKLVEARNTEEYPLDNHKCGNLEFKLGEDNFSYRVCKGDYDFVMPDTRATFKYHKGYFGFPYVTDLKFPELETMDAYLATGIPEKDLRQLNVLFFYQKDKTSSFKVRLKRWENDCNVTSGYECRLISYVLEDKKEMDKAVALLKKSCGAGKDPVACRNLIRNKALSKADTEFAKKQLQLGCSKGSLDDCSELAWTLMVIGDFDKKEVIGLLEKPCKSGNRDACKSIKSLE